MSHLKSFSLVCFHLCFESAELIANLFWQILQWYGFSPVWVLQCSVSLSRLLNILGQSSHSNVILLELFLLYRTNSYKYVYVTFLSILIDSGTRTSFLVYCFLRDNFVFIISVPRELKYRSTRRRIFFLRFLNKCL